jgi:hypothetical protein
MDGTLYIRIEFPRANVSLNDRMLGTNEPPIYHQQEDEERDDDPDHELEEVIPDVVDIRHDLLPQLLPFVGLLSLEELQHELIGK